MNMKSYSQLDNKFCPGNRKGNQINIDSSLQKACTINHKPQRELFPRQTLT